MSKKYTILLLVFNFFISCSVQKKTPSPAENFRFHGKKETLDTISNIIEKKEKGIFIRLGYKELMLLTGSNASLQKHSELLSNEISETFELTGKHVLKALPLHCKERGTLEEGMNLGNHENKTKFCNSIIKLAKRFSKKRINEAYSPAALHFTATTKQNDFVTFLGLLQNNHCIFVGNKNIPKDKIRLFFGPNCTHIQTPPEQAYDKIDEIEKACLEKLSNNNAYKIVIASAGPAGKILLKRLWEKTDNIFFIDFGSLIDALCGWKTKSWMVNSVFDIDKIIELLTNKPTVVKKRTPMSDKIKIVFTAALIDNHFEERKLEYIKSLKTIKSFGYEPYIVEACKERPTFFDDYSCNVLYPNENLPDVDKGVNEARSVLAICEHFNFKDDDMVVKITGRYCLQDDYFIRFVETYSNADIIFKWWAKGGLVFTGCFAMKYKYLKKMLIGYILKKFKMMDENDESFCIIESFCTDYLENIKKDNGKIIILDKIHLWTNLYATGEDYEPHNYVRF